MSSSRLESTGLLALRIVLGTILCAHGLQKVFGMFGGPGMENFSGFIKSLNIPFPVIMAYLASLSELVGGFFILIGLFPRVSALFNAITMIVAIVSVHGSGGLFAKDGGFEYPLLILAVCISLIFTGSGKYSVYDKL